jgi:hypothetical protein
MKKTSTTPDPWNDAGDPELIEQAEVIEPVVSLPTKPYQPVEYSLAGLRADFPTARELEQFVFDERAISLKLRGIDPEKKYEVALAVLNNEEVDLRYISGANPYVDNTELIPEDPIKPIPARDPRLPNEPFMSVFHDRTIPHPDQEMRALDAKVVCQFKTYEDGSISYEIIGPLEKHAVGEKLDKYGRSRPERIVWIDPRTGEQGLRYKDGSFSRMGQRLRTLMESRRVNRNASFWSIWIDRDFTQFNQDKIDNPWD